MSEQSPEDSVQDAGVLIAAAVAVAAIGMAITGPIQWVTAIAGLVLLALGIKKGGLYHV